MIISTFNIIESALIQMQLLNTEFETPMREALIWGDYTTAYEVAYLDSLRCDDQQQLSAQCDTERIVDQAMAALGHQED